MPTRFVIPAGDVLGPPWYAVLPGVSAGSSASRDTWIWLAWAIRAAWLMRIESLAAGPAGAESHPVGRGQPPGQPERRQQVPDRAARRVLGQRGQACWRRSGPAGERDPGEYRA